MFLRSLILMILLIGLIPARAVFAQDAAMAGYPRPATPLTWKWDRLAGSSSYIYVAANPGRPLVLFLPEMWGDWEPQQHDHFFRFLHDQGYAVGRLDWRSRRDREQSPSAAAAQLDRELSQLLDLGTRRGFRSDRVILVGSGENAILVLATAARRSRIAQLGASNPICAAVIFDGSNIDSISADTTGGRTRFERDPGSAAMALSAMAPAAPPTLLLVQSLDRSSVARSAKLAGALRHAGRPVAEATYPQFRAQDQATYLGFEAFEPTRGIGLFLQSHCPAKRH